MKVLMNIIGYMIMLIIYLSAEAASAKLGLYFGEKFADFSIMIVLACGIIYGRAEILKLEGARSFKSWLGLNPFVFLLLWFLLIAFVNALEAHVLGKKLDLSYEEQHISIIVNNSTKT